MSVPAGGRARRDAARRPAILAAAAIVSLAVGLFAMSPAPVGVFWDDAVYVISAKALATGHGYQYIHLPGTPAATHYPPLWPALLSLIWRIAPDFPDNVRLMKLLNPVLLAAAAAAGTLLAMRVSRTRHWMDALVVAASIAVAPMLMLSAVLMSEPLALALSAAGLAAATLAIVRGRRVDGAVAGVLVGLAILARSATIVLLPALAVGLLWRRSRASSAVALAAALLLAVPWFLWSGARAHELPPILAGSYGPYSSWIVGAYREDPALLIEVVRANAASAYHDAGVVLFSAMPFWIRPVLLAPLLAMVVAGLAIARRRAAPLTTVLATYTVLFIIWPYTPGRFMWALFPLYAVGAIVATASIARRVRGTRYGRAITFATSGLALLTLANVIRYDVVGLMRGFHRVAIERNADAAVPAVGWIGRYTTPTDTIASDVHLIAYLYTGRIALPVNSLTVSEHVRPKTQDEMRREFAVIDSSFHPKWWVLTAIVPERETLRIWGLEPNSTLERAAELPGGGLVGRRVRK